MGVVCHLYREPRSKESSKIRAHSQNQGFPYVVKIAVSRGDCKIYTKWDQPTSEVQIALFLPRGGVPPLLAEMRVRPPWCFPQCLKLVFRSKLVMIHLAAVKGLLLINNLSKVILSESQW